MSALQQAFLYLFLGLGLLGLVSAACAAAYARHRQINDSDRSGASEGRWPQ